MLVNSVYCQIEGCKNTAHCRIDGLALCAPCIGSMSMMNSDNEAYFRAALAVATPITDCTWQCGPCGTQWDSFHIRNGVCLDCRSIMPLLWVD